MDEGAERRSRLYLEEALREQVHQATIPAREEIFADPTFRNAFNDLNELEEARTNLMEASSALLGQGTQPVSRDTDVVGLPKEQVTIQAHRALVDANEQIIAGKRSADIPYAQAMDRVEQLFGELFTQLSPLVGELNTQTQPKLVRTILNSLKQPPPPK